jgi:CBS domain-containing protein
LVVHVFHDNFLRTIVTTGKFAAVSSVFVLPFGDTLRKGSANFAGGAKHRVRRTTRPHAGDGSMQITVRDLAVPAVAVAEQKMSIAAARDLMLRWNASETYVVDRRGKLLGVVPDYEFLKAELGGTSSEKPIGTLVSTKVEAVEADADVATVFTKFRESWCGRIAVTDKGRLIGRLTRAEVLRLVVHLRQIASVTEITADVAISKPHFGGRRERLTPVRKTSRAKRSNGPRKLRRLLAG